MPADWIQAARRSHWKPRYSTSKCLLMAADDVKFCTKLVHGGSLEDHDGTTCVYISIYLDVHIHIYNIYIHIYNI